MSLLSEDREPFRLRPFKPNGNPSSHDNLFSFTGSVGPNGDNRREDVIKTQILLGNSGDYDLAALGAPTGWPGGELYRGIKRYQKRQGVEADGLLLPLGANGVDRNGVGETLAALQSDLGEALSGYGVPTPQQVDTHYEERAKRMQAGDEEGGKTSAPYSMIAVAGPDGALPQQPVGMMPSTPAKSQTSPVAHHPQLGFTVREAGSPANTGEQVAFYDQATVHTKPMVGPGSGGGGPPVTIQGITQGLRNLLTGVAATALSSDAEKLEQASPHVPDHDQARTPDPAQPEIETPDDNAPAQPPLPKGRVILAPDGTEVNVPALGKWVESVSRDERDIAEAMANAFAVEMAMRPGSRGHEWTQKGVDIYIQECLNSANEDFPELKGNVRHVAGGTQDGAGDKPIKEEYLANVIDGLKARLGSGRTDFVLEFVRNTVQRWRADTMSTDRQGNRTADETRRQENHKRLTEGERVAGFDKFPEGMSEANMRKEARAQCRDELAKWVEDLRKTGEFDKPKPEMPAGDYPGHSILRKLKK